VSEENIAPKGILREMLESWAGFVEYVNENAMQRIEGLLLRYLSGCWRTLAQTVPEEHTDDQLIEIEAWLRAMLARTLETAELLDRIGHVVTVGILHPVEAAAGATIADDVERIKRPEQSLGRRERHGNPLDERGPGAVDRGWGDADESFIALIARDQPALGIGGQTDPRAEFVSRDGEHPLDYEALRHGKRRGIVGGRRRGPAVGHGDDRLLPPGHGGRRVRRS
jgi:hypothetical protein